MRCWLLALVAFIPGACTFAAPKPQVIVSLSCSSPDTAYVRKYGEWLERRPFDGIGLSICPEDAGMTLDYKHDRSGGSLTLAMDKGMTGLAATGPWNPANRYTEKTISLALADLRAVKLTKLKFNLIPALINSAAPADWFSDDEWEVRCSNFAMLARLAKQGGCRGIMFDDEEYTATSFNYDALKKQDKLGGRDYETVRRMARQRGRQFAKAICAEFPDIVFWTLHGYSTVALLVEQGLPEYARSLRPPFYDGMLEGASANMVFVDGGELAYGFNTREHFEFGRKMIKDAPIQMGLTQVPDLHRRRVKCGFGLFTDYYGKVDPDNPENTYFSPGRLQRAVYWALKVGDGYVWTWNEGWTWWTEGPEDRAPVGLWQKGFPHAYWAAIEAGRKSPGRDTSPARGTPTGLATHGRNYCIDGDQLPALLAKCEKVYELPTNGWTFKLDDWGNEFDDPKTFDKPIDIGSTWEKQGFTGKDTIGWYRLEFQLPESLKGRKLHLYVPDLDGSIWLASMSCPRPQTMAWRYIGLEPKSNRKPFVLTNPQLSSFFFEPGKPATVVIKIQGLKVPGGIMAPIQVLAER